MKSLKDCNPNIVNRDTLMTGELEFMNKNDIRERCNCEKKSICLQIIDLLDNNKLNEAEQLIEWM